MSMTNEEASNILRLVATEALEGVSRFVESENNLDMFKQAYEMAIKELKRQKGKWLYADDVFEDAVCSSCKWDSGETMQHARKTFKFCPNCGAEME